MNDSTARQVRGNIIALIPDVFFSVTVRNTIRRLDYDAHIVKSTEDLVDAVTTESSVLVLVDMEAVRDESDWDDIAGLARWGVPVLVFGPHRDVDGFRRAKQAGIARVVANSQFHREMPTLIERYARGNVQVPYIEPELDDADSGSTVPPGAVDGSRLDWPPPNDAERPE